MPGHDALEHAQMLQMERAKAFAVQADPFETE
jgi:hypothetical protein